ncbi:protein F37C4.5 isoform X2 [Hydra vulgaris]|uniref:Protein F37C4.5 isoform X2 n=1 Tax=Hydra vulgaris TaxID=6087 RepID=A0ABM4BJ93_HYDVU
MNQEKLLVQSISTKDNEDSIQIDISDKPKVNHSKSTVHELFAKQCPTLNVTVFKDRAEVNRIVKVDVEEGDTEILIRQLPSIIQKDSIRVTCYTESVTIVEVAFQIKSVVENSSNEDEENLKVESESDKILKRLKILKKEKTVLLEKLKRNEKEVSILDSYANCITEKKEDKVGEILDKKSIESMLHFLSIYKDRSEKITDLTISLNENLESINKEIEVLTDNLNRLQPPKKEYREESCISILLNVKKNTNASLVVSYVVHPFASWTPFYDVRAFSADDSLQILYFANVCQSTGEDWNDCKITLSTALPSVGGSPPELLPYNLDLEEPVKIARRSVSKTSFRTSFLKKSHLENIEQDRMLDCAPQACALMLMDSPMPMPVAKALDGMTSTSFEITRLTSIPSDYNDHKVSICQLNFSPKFEYMATPKSVAHAFLNVKANNDSAYPLLSGYANVFLDSNFLTRTSLPAVSPMEDFEIALGVDPAVKVTYKPLRKFQQTSGILSKTQVYDFHQQIEIKNTKRDAIKIKVTDQCPKSTNEKIKVTLKEPDIKIPKSTSTSEPPLITHDNVTLHTSDYKLEWILEIASNETKTINLRYEVEHPVDSIVRGLSL